MISDEPGSRSRSCCGWLQKLGKTESARHAIRLSSPQQTCTVLEEIHMTWRVFSSYVTRQRPLNNVLWGCTLSEFRCTLKFDRTRPQMTVLCVPVTTNALSLLLTICHCSIAFRFQEISFARPLNARGEKDRENQQKRTISVHLVFDMFQSAV